MGAKKCLLSLGFTDFEVREAAGFSGGIWLLWNKNKVTVEFVDSTFQSISVNVSWLGSSPWLLSGIDSLPARIGLPWLLLGDFNELLSFADKIGGSNHYRFGGMQDWVCRNGLIDMGYQGADFTWTNNNVKERLDRSFCDGGWRLRFPDACLVHLARMKSDHCPILVRLFPSSRGPKLNSPFRFQAMWMNHEKYPQLISEVWSTCSGDLVSKVNNLAGSLNDWNRSVFGNIFKQKRVLLARICGIQKSLGRRHNEFLQNLEKELISKYENVRDAEALFWKQKSRDKWLRDGDRNTKFFHLTTIIRRRNKIDGLFDKNGVWTEDVCDMRKIVVEFFKDLFDAEPIQDLRIIIPSLFPDTSASEIADMSRLVSESDAHDALFRIGQLKAPGVDGFPALFFQNHWDLCAPEIMDVVKQAFSSGIIPAGLNHTLITLVPKISAPKHMHLFRPISLCCTVYKIISKIIVDRIRPMLKKLISPNQVSFVPGRKISDNIMIAQEILHKCKNAKGTKGFMAWKVDLSKAYDRLNWNFIEQVLYEVKIPIQLVKLIMSCVSTASYQIVLNGELSESFTCSRGIRQGDPLSPYLFVLCMEKLSHTIQHAIEMNYWKPIQSSQSGPFISHLFFADDLILFSEASTSQATIMKCCMDTFCNLSGQSVSLEKSMVYCSPNVSSDLANRISSICGSPITEDLGVYLGMPLIHSRVSAATYTNLVDKVQTRLAS
ncbi:hypothetical protein ACLB2K_067037 [Fragaria x ananassa]